MSLTCRIGKVAIGLTLLPALLGGCAGRDSVPPAPFEFLNLAPEVAYLGGDACKDCHLGHSTTYAGTGMGQSAYELTPETSVEHFAIDNEFVDQRSGLHYRMTERDGRFYQRQFMLAADNSEIAAEEREISLVIGSNNHCRAYVNELDGKLFQAPICWYPQAEKWDYCPGFQHENSHFAREISASCVFCHNGRMELVRGERNLFKQPIPHGIGCERCHGPGQLHVQRWTAGETPHGEADPTIVNPRRLDRWLRMDVCSQCHLGDAKQTERVARHDREQESFRPGQPLTDVIVPFRYAQQTQFDFSLASQADRLMLSPCYTRGEIECLTCHNPHISVNHPDRPTDHFRQKCLGCHGLSDCAAPQADRAATGRIPDDCVACHMRKAEPDDQRFTEFTDHWIRRDIDVAERDHRESFELEPIFPEHLASLPSGERLYYTARAEFLRANDAPPQARAPMRERAVRSFRQAIAEGFDAADAWFFLGKTLGLQGEHEAAIEAYRASLERDPGDHDAAFALGQTLGGLGRNSEALQVFQGMLERDPGNAMVLSEYGRIAFSLGRADAALAAYDKAIAREPWNPTVQLNLGMSLAGAGRFVEAAEAGVRAVQLDPDNAGAWNLYWNAMREAGRDQEAAEGRRQFERLETHE